jgi:erythromycin esterase-like protein
MKNREALDAVRAAAQWFPSPSGGGVAGRSMEAFATLLDLIGDARLVMIGEATHGTDEFYSIRAALTKALIRSKQFNLVAAEADWPDAYRINRWVRHRSADADAPAALAAFVRFPRWMWRNTVVVDFVEWLRRYNAKRMASDRIGFYGLDLYSLHASIAAVLEYLRKVDPDAAARARHRYSCFEHFGLDPQSYGYAANFGLSRSCEDDVVAQLVELRHAAAEYARRDGLIAEEDYFFAEQNARLVRNAEMYYRAMFAGQVESWNLRDTHMMETLDALMAWTTRRSGYVRAVVWAHNSHLGDARATQMGTWGELNLGQLARERLGDRVFLIGFTTHTGTVTAAREWDQPAERRRVTPSMSGSYERLFHDVDIDRFVLATSVAREALAEARLERAIGVIYKPESERASHYFRATMADQFDAVIHIDTTSALTPLERWSRENSDLPETYPTGV